MRYRLIIVCCLVCVISCAGRRPGTPGRRTERTVTHRVLGGETWESIARDYYGDRSRAEEVAAHNGFVGHEQPPVGVGIRIPLSRHDVRSLEKRLEAARIYNIGLELASSGNFAEAVMKFEEALRIDTGMKEARFNLAISYQKQGLQRRAIALLGELLSSYPENREYHFALGHSLFSTGDLAGAEASFRQTLAIDPLHLKALFSIAVVHEKMGKEKMAAAEWKRYLDLDPGSEWADEARSRLDILLRSNP